MRNVYIGSAWPYVNGPLHTGHIAGLLPADVLARAHRLFGDKVLWTSGSDCHGTPITERARQEGCEPCDIARRFHNVVSRTFERLGFSYSLYWATMEAEHERMVQESFLALHELGLIVEDDYQHAHCATCNDSRADREINGMCPHCGNDARGDQCDHCSETLDPSELTDPVCSKCSCSITFKKTRELFFDLPALEERLRPWVSAQTHWRDNAKSWTQSWLEIGLKKRAITRKIDWGIPVPLPGWKDRRIYVWFEAVHGYWTASVQWATDNGDPDAWKSFWFGEPPDTIAYYVIGKDNIPFHTLMWPGILIARGMTLPWHIVSSEYLIFEDRKLSTSKGWVLWADDVLDRFDPDYLRYFLIAQGPEKQDTNFTWERFVRIINGEVVDNYGNLVNRVLSFAKKRFDGKMPAMSRLDDTDQALIVLASGTFAEVKQLIEQTELRRAAEKVMALVQATNRYFNDRAPWREQKEHGLERAGSTVAVAINIIAALSILTEPFMPFQAARLRSMLNLPKDRFTWQQPWLTPGSTIGEVECLFEKLDEEVIELERTRLEEQLASMRT